MDDFYINKIGMEVIEQNDSKTVYRFQHTMIHSNQLQIIHDLLLIGG